MLTCLLGLFLNLSCAVQVPEPIHMQQLSGRKIRGMLNVLEEGQAAALFASLPGGFPGLPQGAAPELVVRLPAPYAALLVAGAWQSFALTQVPPEPGALAGTSGLQFNWKTLNNPRHLIPAAPANLAQFKDSDPELTADTALEIADTLRDYAVQLGDAALADHVGLQRCVAVMQRVHEHLSPLAFVKKARALRGKNLWTDVCRRLSTRVPYQVAFMLRVMLMSGVLRSSSDLRESLMMAMSIVLPPTLLPTFQNLLRTLSDIIPAASTVSRWRLVLDAAIMVHQRGVNDASGSGWVRFLMADSSAQHGRNFEHIVVCSMRGDTLADALQQANELTKMWRSAVKLKPLLLV